MNAKLLFCPDFSQGAVFLKCIGGVTAPTQQIILQSLKDGLDMSVQFVCNGVLKIPFYPGRSMFDKIREIIYIRVRMLVEMERPEGCIDGRFKGDSLLQGFEDWIYAND